MRRVIGAIVVSAVLAAGLTFALLAHQASAKTHMTVHVTLKDYRVIVAQRQLPAGKPITFVVTNRGHHMHEFVLEPRHAVDKALRVDGKDYEADMIAPGTTRTVTWTIPRPGAYKLACHMDHHYQKGMWTPVTATSGSA